MAVAEWTVYEALVWTITWMNVKQIRKSWNLHSLLLFIFIELSIIALHVQNVFAAIVERKEQVPFNVVEKMGNSCTSVIPNTLAWEQQDWNKTMKQRKKVRWEWMWKEVQRTRKKRSRPVTHNSQSPSSSQLLLWISM